VSYFITDSLVPVSVSPCQVSIARPSASYFVDVLLPLSVTDV